jgi:tRNA dimethylallyltransferase
MYLEKELSYEEMFSKLNIAIRQFAKRQMTWFRRMERSGIKINWIEGMLEESEKIETMINHHFLTGIFD